MPQSKTGVVLRDVTRRLKAWLRQLVRRHDMMTYDWEELDWDDTTELREWAKAQMAEGYLADSEEAFIDKLFDELQQKREVNEELKDILLEQNRTEVN